MTALIVLSCRTCLANDWVMATKISIKMTKSTTHSIYTCVCLINYEFLCSCVCNVYCEVHAAHFQDDEESGDEEESEEEKRPAKKSAAKTKPGELVN